MLGLSKSDIAGKIKFSYHGVMVTSKNRELEVVADRIADTVATAIEENNAKITQQLKDAGIKLT
jgi:UDP-N-acetylmuramyl tripeptide synthase